MEKILTTQPDLFGESEAADTHRYVDCLTCLRDANPRALEVITELSYPARQPDTRKPLSCGAWAYAVTRAGPRHERADDWWRGTPGQSRGWDRLPAHLVTWQELATLVADHPLRPQLQTWSRSLSTPDAWRDRRRPYQMWPQPDSWHPDYRRRDRDRPCWPQRHAAWQKVLQICDDAIAVLTIHAET